MYFVQKEPIKVQVFETFLSARVEIHQIPHLTLERQVNSSSNFASYFIVTTDNSSVNCKLIHFVLRIKGSHQSPNFKIFQLLWWKSTIFLMLFWKIQVSFPSNFASIFSVIKLLCTCLAQTLYTLFKRNPLKWKFLRVWVLGSEFVKLFMSTLKRKVNSSSNFAFFIVMTHNCSVKFKLVHFLL